MRSRARAHGLHKYAGFGLFLANFFFMLIAIDPFDDKGIRDSNGKFRFYQWISCL